MKRMIETFNTPIDYEIVREDSIELRMKFTAGEIDYEFVAYHDFLTLHMISTSVQLPIILEVAYVIEFGVKVSDISAPDSSEARYGVTGTGNEGTVFGQVKNCMDYFVKKHNPKQFIFSASHRYKSRVKIYNTFSMAIAREYNYIFQTDSNASTTYYLYTRHDVPEIIR